MSRTTRFDKPFSVLVLTCSILAAGAPLPAHEAPCPVSSTGTGDPPTGELVVSILEVDPVTDLEGDDDNVPIYDNHADVYGRVTIDGNVFALPKIEENDHPFWGSDGVFVQPVSAVPDPTGLTPLPIPIRIEIFEADGGTTGGDDVVDVNPQPGKTELDLVFDLCSLEITGDVVASGSQAVLESSGGDGDSDAAIRFTVGLADARPMSVDDLALVGFDLVQVVPQVDRLVAGKPTVLQVQVANNYTTDVVPELRVRITAAGTVFTDDLFTLHPLAGGAVSSSYLYESSPLVFPAGLNGGDPYDVFVNLTLDPGGHYPDTGHAKPEDCRARNNGGNLRPRWRVVPTAPPSVLWTKTGLLLDVGNTTPDSRFEEIRDLGEAFIRGTFPIADLPQSTSPIPIFPPGTTVIDWLDVILPYVDAAEPYLMVAELGGIGYLAGYDRTLGVLPHRHWFEQHTGWSGVTGLSLGDALPAAVLFLPRNGDDANPGPAIALPAHELGHTYALSVDSTIKDHFLCSQTDVPLITTLICGIVGGYDEYNHADHPEGIPSRGYWVAQGGETAAVSHLLDKEQCESHCLMGSSPANAHLPPATSNDPPAWNDDGRWIEPAGYESLFDQLEATGSWLPLVAPDTLHVSALVTDDGRFFPASHWFRVRGDRAVDVLEPGAAEWGRLRFRDAAGAVLDETPLPYRPLRLHRPGAEDLPLSIVGRTVAFPAAARVIEVVRHLEDGGEDLVYVRPVSTAEPVVTVLAPDGSRHAWGEPLEVVWQSSDRDGDDLLHTVLVSESRSGAWWPVAVHVDGQRVAVDTADLAAGVYRLKVLAADGIHVGESAEVDFELR